ncbi:MAG: NAD(P)/FAD-dependent oxidoreductase [Acidimicrobiales bacterium]
MRHVVIVGASLAGTRAAETLRREGFDGTITLIGEESEAPYERPPLSKQYLSGKWGRDRLALRTDGDLVADLGVDLKLGQRAIGLDLDRRRITFTRAGAAFARAGAGAQRPPIEVVDFDGLVIATGARVRHLPGSESLAGVYTLRTLADADLLQSALGKRPRVAVVGAGFIGSEVASTCRELGLEVSVVEALPQPLSRVLGGDMGAVLAGLHTDGGTDLHLGVEVDGLVGSGQVEGVRLSDGRVIPADVVVVGIGVIPNTDWLEGSGLALDNGVVCDATCAALLAPGRADDNSGASDRSENEVAAGGSAEGLAVAEGVVAAGDVARWHHRVFGEPMRVEHWDNATLQGEHAVRTLLAGPGEAQPYTEVGFFWSDQYGAKIQFVGTCRPDDDMVVAEGSVDDRKFIAAYGRAGRIVGALGVNRAFRMMAYRTMVAEQAPFPPPLVP